MTDRPIIFSGAMVRALLEGRKTMTRRVLRVQPGALDHPFQMGDGSWHVTDSQGGHLSSLNVPYAPGDRLWVREVCATWEGNTKDAAYRATMGDDNWSDLLHDFRHGAPWKLRSPIHMPRWASRITLTVTEVRVQRVQDISEADAVAEGMIWSEPTDEDREWARAYAEENGGDGDIRGVWLAPGTRQGYGMNKEQCQQMQWGPTAAFAFRCTWNSLHGPDAWDANPWVVALTFTVRLGNIDA